MDFLASSTESYCFKFDTLHIRLDEEFGKIVVEKCCLKKNIENRIKEYSFDEFLQLSDVYQELSSLVNIIPPHWNDSLEGNCPVPVKKCNFSKVDCKLRGIEVSIDYHCNAKCKFCGSYLFGVPRLKELGLLEKLPGVYFKILESIKGHKLEYLRLTDSGEPFFFKQQTIEYLTSLTENDTKMVWITTNLSCLTKSDIENLFSNIHVGVNMNISLNAWDKESYKRIMGIDAWDRVIENIETLIDIKETFSQVFQMNVSFVVETVEEVRPLANFIRNNINTFQNVFIIRDLVADNKEVSSEIQKAFGNEGMISNVRAEYLLES